MNTSTSAADGDNRDNSGSHGPTGWDAVLIDMYQSHFRELVGLARRLLDTTAMAEEAVQESFVRYHLAAHKPADGKELPYLRSIVLNQSRSMLRRRRTASSYRPERPLHNPSGESDWLERLESDLVHRALSGLPSRQRQVLTCRHLVGMSERETASALDISVGSVKTHSSRGRTALRGLMSVA